MSTEDKISNTIKSFTDINDCFRGTIWEGLFPPNTYGETVSFDFGQEIGNTNEDGCVTFDTRIHVKQPLGIILKGEAELYESSLFDDRFVAYRPIRLMQKDDIFGDFSLVDSVFGDSGPLQSGETWKLAAGRKCMLLLNEIDPDKYPDKFELCDLYASVEKTEIAFVDLQGLQDHQDSPLFMYLYKIAWKRMQTYRLCVNSGYPLKAGHHMASTT